MQPLTFAEGKKTGTDRQHAKTSTKTTSFLSASDLPSTAVGDVFTTCLQRVEAVQVDVVVTFFLFPPAAELVLFYMALEEMRLLVSITQTRNLHAPNPEALVADLKACACRKLCSIFQKRFNFFHIRSRSKAGCSLPFAWQLESS